MERRTHAYDGPLVVFLIGARVHKPWRLGIVYRAISSMTRMIAELEKNKALAAKGQAASLGYLGSRFTVHLSGVTVIQWWRSTDDLYAYANAADLVHRPAWLGFYAAAKADPTATTIWHETYAVQPNGAESMYAGPHPFGLAAVAGTVPAGRRGETAGQRLGGTLDAGAPPA